MCRSLGLDDQDMLLVYHKDSAPPIRPTVQSEIRVLNDGRLVKNQDEDKPVGFGNFQLKARVYCQWQEKGGPYYPGRIVGINKRGQFLVQYDDGTFYSYCIYIFSTFFPTVTYPTTTFLFFRFVPDFFVHCFFFFHHGQHIFPT